jgi:hypothetical protein
VPGEGKGRDDDDNAHFRHFLPPVSISSVVSAEFGAELVHRVSGQVTWS